MSEVIKTILTVAELIGAVGVICGFVVALIRWVLKQGKQDDDIKQLKEENTLICYALSACLDGLEQLGANHTVPKARDKLDKYLNVKAHK